MIFVLQGINGKYVRLEEVRQPPSTDIGENGEPDLIVKVQFVEDGEVSPDGHATYQSIY